MCFMAVPSQTRGEGGVIFEGIRNGGLDVTQNRRSTWKIHFGRTKPPALQRFFFLSPSCGAGSLGLFGFSFALVRAPLSAGQNSHR